jgi:phage terminase large subunit-like protein
MSNRLPKGQEGRKPQPSADLVTVQEEHSWIREYWQGIESGEIIVGYYVREQVARLVSELDNPDYRIDLHESQKRINFIEKECRHSEAPFAGKPFKLLLFQKAIIEAIFAIKRWNDELGRYVRKYQEIILVLGRKNGKTPLASAISLSEWVCGEMGTKILYGSNDYDQADLLYMATDAMREAAPKLARCTRRNQKGIFWGGRKQKSHVGKFSAQNKGSIRKLSARTSAKEGKNIKVGIVDEVHEMKDNTLVMPIKQALSTQDEPIYIEITTEGFTDNGYLDERLMLARQVLEGEAEKDNLLIFWYTQDNEDEIWRDESSWYKSNPTLGAVKKWSFLRGMVEDARLSASTKAFVLAKDFNIKQNSAAAWLSADVIDNQDTFDPKELEGQFYIGGFDYAETTDLCAAKAVFVDPWTLNKRSLGMYFVPEVKADAIIMGDEANHLNPEQKNYRAWAAKGLVTICPGTEVDPAMVSQWYIGLLRDLHCRPYKIGFDNWHAKQLKDNLAEAFGPDVLERVNMDFLSLNGAMASLESDLTFKKLNYGNNEMDRWCLSNTAFKLNNIGLKMPVKIWNQAKNRIDGTLGLLTAYAAYSRFSSAYLSLQKSVVPQAGR